MRRSLVAFGCAMVVIGGLGAPELRSDDVPFLRGDVNGDGVVSLSDAVMSRRFLFLGEPLNCRDAADADDSGDVDISDPIRILRTLLAGDPPPPAPFPTIGADPTPDSLACAYDLTPAEETDDLIRIGEVVAGPGDDIEIPVYVTTTSQGVEAFQVVLRYDPEIVTIESRLGGNFSTISLDGTFYDDFVSAPVYATRAYANEDAVLIAFIPSLLESGYELPSGEEHLVMKIRGKVSDTASSGTTIALELYNGEGGAGVGEFSAKNELTATGSARLVSVIPKTINGVLEIV
ncbi:MAG TPA: dockerin type I domain-containing protein, partial [Planctomycetota bacterium]|nr:dockerin type I domain-containing protein [Planctomycetota bacterium]